MSGVNLPQTHDVRFSGSKFGADAWSIFHARLISLKIRWILPKDAKKNLWICLDFAPVQESVSSKYRLHFFLGASGLNPSKHGYATKKPQLHEAGSYTTGG